MLNAFPECTLRAKQFYSPLAHKSVHTTYSGECNKAAVSACLLTEAERLRSAPGRVGRPAPRWRPAGGLSAPRDAHQRRILNPPREQPRAIEWAERLAKRKKMLRNASIVSAAPALVCEERKNGFLMMAWCFGLFAFNGFYSTLYIHELLYENKKSSKKTLVY